MCKIKAEQRNVQLLAIQINLSNPKPGHAMGRSGRGGAQRGGRAGRDYVGRQAGSSIQPANNAPSGPPANRENNSEPLFGSTNKLVRS